MFYNNNNLFVYGGNTRFFFFMFLIIQNIFVFYLKLFSGLVLRGVNSICFSPPPPTHPLVHPAALVTHTKQDRRRNNADRVINGRPARRRRVRAANRQQSGRPTNPRPVASDAYPPIAPSTHPPTHPGGGRSTAGRHDRDALTREDSVVAGRRTNGIQRARVVHVFPYLFTKFVNNYFIVFDDKRTGAQLFTR